MSMGGHQSAAALKDEWLTPRHVLDALGPFDLDPCAPQVRPWDTAARHYTVMDNGLEAAQWLARCADHGNAMALIFARTETRMFFDHVWPKAQAVLLLEGRLYFHHVCGRKASANAGAPSVLVAYGSANAECLKGCTLAGRYLAL